MKIFITGGAGYIGSHLVQSLMNSGFEIEIIDKNSPLRITSTQSVGAFHQIDLSSENAPGQLFSIFKNAPSQSIVIHLAGRKSVSESEKYPELYLKNNVGGTRNLLDAIRKSNIRSLIFSSSAAVYGDKEEVVTEFSRCNPLSVYARAKLEEENLIMSAHRDWSLDALVFRFFNVAGAGSPQLVEQNGENLIPMALQASFQKSVLKIFGNDYPTPDGTCLRDYIHVSDIVDAHLLSIEKLHGMGFKILNLGSSNAMSVLQITNKIKEYIPLETNFVGRREGDPAILIANSESAKIALNWSAKLGLDEIIRSSIPNL
jgi:UDP-glucose 4-epimerase